MLRHTTQKTKVILFSTSQMSRRHNLEKAMVDIFNKNQPMERIFDVQVLGMTFNQHLTWRNHINATTKSCYSILKSLRIFKRSADFKLRRSLAHSLILSRINYCNALLSDAPMYLLKKLQKIQNAAARFVYGRQVDGNDVIGLKWLPVRERISLSLAKLTHKALHDPSWPSYLTVRRPTPRGRNIRSEGGLTVELSNCLDGSFAKQAVNTFNELRFP